MSTLLPPIPGTIQAPFTLTQVVALNLWQLDIRVHPFTCPNRSGHLDRGERDLGILVATPNGWICRDCDYTQPWAHAFMGRLPDMEVVRRGLWPEALIITADGACFGGGPDERPL